VKTKLRFPLVFAAVFSAAAVFFYATGVVGFPFAAPLIGAEYAWYDAMFTLQGNSLPTGDPRLVFLAVDDATVHHFGFPLPRVAYAQALDRLKGLGVKTAAFDILFLEPRAGDAELTAATKRFGHVVHLFTTADIETGKNGSGQSSELPIPGLRRTAQYLGSPVLRQFLSADGHVRTYALFNGALRDPIRPGWASTSLAAAALASYLDVPLEEIEARYGTRVYGINYRRPTIRPLHEDPRAVANDPNKLPVLSPYRMISMMDLLKGQLGPEQKKALKGSLVLIGSTSTGYFDHYPDPFSGSTPGGEYHLNILDDVLNHDGLIPTSHWYVVVLILLGAWAPLLLLALSPIASVGAALAILAAFVWVPLHLLVAKHLIVNVAVPILAFLGSFTTISLHRLMTEGAEKKMIKGLFGQFVAPEVVDQLAQDPSKVKLGGEKRELTVFFLDIAHFTNISEKMDPEALILFLNRYLSALSEPILESHGTIDKYIGDCIMAFWNAPVEDKDHRADAVLAALACQDIIKDLNKTLDKAIPEVPAVRIGINSGVATVALTGTQRKLQYTAIGDEVNLASRLEGANKFFGSKIIISGSTYDGCQDRVEARYLGKARVVGKETPIAVYEPLAAKGKLPPEWTKALPLYAKGVEDFDARRYPEALESFKAFSGLMPDDGPGQLYLRLSTDYAALPPDESWQGVFNLTAK
jgi:adenylate cyclase